MTRRPAPLCVQFLAGSQPAISLDNPTETVWLLHCLFCYKREGPVWSWDTPPVLALNLRPHGDWVMSFRDASKRCESRIGVFSLGQSPAQFLILILLAIHPQRITRHLGRSWGSGAALNSEKSEGARRHIHGDRSAPITLLIKRDHSRGNSATRPRSCSAA